MSSIVNDPYRNNLGRGYYLTGFQELFFVPVGGYEPMEKVIPPADHLALCVRTEGFWCRSKLRIMTFVYCYVRSWKKQKNHVKNFFQFFEKKCAE